ncbi:predicted protein [Phaeodactylum tricornutum CCAP 1055/1]|uniref:Ankyrin repeat protein n=1 Tax=Phaeodactylum tricornutum (strain CCAP 1055/1) TaxID=556484 RepID=B7FPA9_PHATC|nr:predicted protein [Phaeodactylum tricornutum CCAP 1055/1]EEC51647.1 predicted protein [Phaeodactylum tricornutum CCAP 1055/1]|eukprot:XP_002177184.1 predicted protein [Phaeodactylum tricornutum CCAP 1055/1]
MFGWATQQFEKLSQTVAPPPTDPASRFVFCCQKLDEDGAIKCVSELYGVATIVVAVKGQVPLHVACTYALPTLIRHILSQPGADPNVVDASGNTPLHCAVMSNNQETTLMVVKMLLQEYQASVLAKNASGQTPYDVASLNMVRQFLLPLQLQQETQAALDNGGVGLPPGIDMGGLKISNAHLPPPPHGPHERRRHVVDEHWWDPLRTTTLLGNWTPSNIHCAIGTLYITVIGTLERVSARFYPIATVSPLAIPGPPSSGNSDYARTGSSSAAFYKPSSQSGRSFIRPDGFHSSSSDKSLQQKYGHDTTAYSNAPPPPMSSGNAITSAPSSLNGNAGPNPFAGGASAMRQRGSGRYVAYGPVSIHPHSFNGATNAGSVPIPAYTNFAPAPVTGQDSEFSHASVYSHQETLSGAGLISTNTPNGSAQNIPSPVATGSVTANFPPPPSRQQPGALAAQNSQREVSGWSQTSRSSSMGSTPSGHGIARVSSTNSAADVFATPSPDKAHRPAAEQSTIPSPQNLHQSMSEQSPASALFSKPSPTVAADIFGAPKPEPSVTETFAQGSGAPIVTEGSGGTTTVRPSQSVQSGNFPLVAPGPGNIAADLFSKPAVASAIRNPVAVAEAGSGFPCSQNQSYVPSPDDSNVPAEDGEDTMHEVPLTPSIEPPKQATGTASDLKGTENALFQAIGMPPPPFSKK